MNKFNPRLEVLEDRTLLAVFHVGPGQTYVNPHNVPVLQPGDEMQIHWRAQDYFSKLGVNYSDVTIRGLPGPNGELPVLNGAGAQEQAGLTWYTTGIENAGLIVVAPAVGVQNISNVNIIGLELKNAHPDGIGYFSQFGQNYGWGPSAAGVAIYRSQWVGIQGCKIHHNGNGIFGKSEGNFYGDLRNIYVGGNWILQNGVAGSDRQHNSYIEGINTIYEFNFYEEPIPESAGLNLKDRGAGTVIRYNHIQGGLRLLDLVEPDDGAPTFVQEPNFGYVWVYGNTLRNPEWTGANAMVHLGTGYDGPYPQHTLYFYNNTVVNVNDRDVGGRWYTYVFKLDENPTVHLYNNIFESVSPDPTHWSGDFYLSTGAGTYFLGTNYFPSWTIPPATTPGNWANQVFGNDAGMVDPVFYDYRLRPDSVCLGEGEALPEWAYGYFPAYQWTGVDWEERDSIFSLGSWEMGVA